MFEVSVNGKLKLEDAVEFLDKDSVTLIYNGRKVPNVGERYNSEDEFIIKKCLEWIKKAKAEKDGFNKFFALWVGYNAFYNLYYRKIHGSLENSGQVERILETKNLLKLEEIRAILQECLQKIKKILNETYYVYLGRGRNRRDVKRDLEERIREFKESSNNKTIIENTFKTLLKFLYGIRNNLFHGDKRLSDDRQNELLNYAYEILLPILSIMLIKYCLTYIQTTQYRY